jgi:hypothetical protein
MGVQRGAGNVVALYMERGVSRLVLGQVGPTEGLWLGERDGGEGPGGLRVVFLEKDQREREKGLLQGFL